MSKELQRKLDEALGSLLLRCRDRVLELAQTNSNLINHFNVTRDKRGTINVVAYSFPNNGGVVEVITSGPNRDSTITYRLTHSGRKITLSGMKVGDAFTFVPPYMQWKLFVQEGDETLEAWHRATQDECVASTLSILLNTVYQRNVDNALDGQIEFIEQVIKSLEK